MIELILLFICFLNFIILLMLSSFLINLADVVRDVKKSIEDFYYMESRVNQPKPKQQEEKGLIDI